MFTWEKFKIVQAGQAFEIIKLKRHTFETYSVPLADTITGVDWTLHKGGEKMCPVIAAS